MLLRFTLSNTIEGNHTISDPDGWKEIKLKLDRDKEYHSLVEIVELPLIFYRSSDLVDGGYDYITNVLQTQGIDAQIGISIESSEDDGDTYETFFQGLLLLETKKDISDAESYKLECNIARTSLWSKFFSRKSQDVNLNSSTSLDGDSLTAVHDIDLSLPSQKIRSYYMAYMDKTAGFPGLDGVEVTDTNDYVQFDWNIVTIGEVEKKFSLPIGSNAVQPVNILELKYAGSYTFEVTIDIADFSLQGTGPQVYPSTYLEIYFKVDTDTATAFTKTDLTTIFAPLRTRYTFSQTITIDYQGANISIYGVRSNNDHFYISYQQYNTVESIDILNNISITANTIYDSTATDAFLLRDAAESILSKIVGRNNVLYSDYLGDTANGCASNFAIMKGLHIRGYSMNDKPMTMSFEDWWNGANPIFNLGLGYEIIAGTEYIRIEHKGYFYDSMPSLTLDYVGGIVKTYDKDSIFKSIEIGYEKWAAESDSGVDDPQTKHTYNTRFKIIGKDEKVLSRFIAASLAIEQTRRNRIELGKDWRLDEDIIIIALSADSSPYQPETDAEFTGITDLLNSDTRYNIRLTPARNFERWKPFFNGCLQVYVAEYYKFASGEGNIKTVSTGIGTCDSGTLAENQDIAITNSFYHSHDQYEFEDDLTFEDYKTIRDNPTKAVLVSNTNANHVTFFIDSLEYDRYNSRAKFTGWIKE